MFNLVIGGTDCAASGVRQWTVIFRVPFQGSALTCEGTSVAFSTGDTVVHPRHGVAKVQGTPTRKGTDGTQDYLELAFEAKGMTIMVPVDSLDEIGIRQVASKEEADEILALLEEDTEVPQAWAERNASTVSRIQSTDLLQAALVIRDLTLHARRAEKPLSAAENASLQGCLETVCSELALTLDLTPEQTRELVLEKVGLANLEL
jgi:CarD family transcriptional regulator